MKLCIAQINPTIGDLEGNTNKILRYITEAKAHSPDIILFPELSICGYPPADLLLHDAFVQKMQTCVDRLVRASSRLTLVVGVARHNHSRGEKPLFNSAAVIRDGQILGFYDKRLLPTYDVFDERRYFEPGHEVKIWELNGKRIGIIICEDIWHHAGYADTRYSHDPILDLSTSKLDLLLNLSASPYQFQKPATRIQVCSKAARTLRCPVVLCCQVGGNDELVFDGYSVYVDQQGNLRQLGKGFEEELLVVDLQAPACHLPFQYNETEDLYYALVLGVRDYFAKQGFKKACLGISGGIDSALVACIAVEALGPENILGVSMPSRYSSEGSIADAITLAHNLGMTLQKIPIEDFFAVSLEQLHPHFRGLPVDTTEENLQARIRGMILMALSNKLGYIVLSTSNKSELGLGYCTLYGDMCGGLGVISDLFKTQVYELAHWINRNREIIPFSIIQRAPSAELRSGQKDSDSLPDYAVIDTVLKEYVEDYLSTEEIAKRHQYSLELVQDLIARLHRGEYKRRQAPVGIRVSKKAFSVGRRFPIVQKWS